MKNIKTTYILLFAGIFSLCIFSFLFYDRIKLLMHSYDMVNRSMQVSLQAEKFFLNLRDASVDFRNYLRLHDSASLTEFNEEINEYPETLSLLRTFEIDNQQQLKKLEQINKLASDYVVYMRSLVEMDKTSAPTTEMLNKQRDKLSNIQSEINALISVEDKIMKNRDNDLSHHIYTTPAFLLAFSLTCIAITVYAFLSIIRQTNSRQALELSEAKFRTLIKQAPVAIGIFKGKDAIIEIINDKARSLSGDDGEKNIGRSLFEVFPVTNAVRTMYEMVLSEGKPFAASDFRLELDHNGITEDGYFDLLFEPLKGIQGETTSVIAVAAETTEKVTAYKKVEESEKHFRAMIENSIDVIVLADMNGIIRFVSASVKNIFGYDETELIGRMALELINPEDIPGLVEIAIPMIEKKQKAFSTVRFLHKDGTWRWIESTLSGCYPAKKHSGYIKTKRK
jgi:PAS domain S-box-containing protein